MAEATLGGFTLGRLLGRGGMADVWHGRHRLSGEPAAIKVITPKWAHEQRFRDGFRREVRAVAGLDHPGIVSVFDAGTVPDAAAGAGLTPGSPWLAMMLAEHGELRRLPTPLEWPTLRDALLQILDALAHAHARDVVHRDLKPENVLLRIEDGRLRLMLTDFGIAHVIEPDGPADGTTVSVAGTPQYMAPEQLRGDWRAFGPWTDLYALGCMAFELASGAAPHAGKTPLQIATRRLTGPIPRVQPVRTMPDGFAGWLERLMQLEPYDRFATAADAACALAALPAPAADMQRRALSRALLGLGAAPASDATVVDGPVSDVERAPVDPNAPTGLAATLTAVVLAGARHGRMAQPASGERADTPASPEGPAALPVAMPVRPPIPETWYGDMPRRPVLRGVGLGLFGVRAMPFVGRDGPRDRLWATLRRAERARGLQAVSIEGSEGIGKTALAEWFARRARELGAAEVLRFRFSALDGAGDGAAAGLRAWFRGHGLDQDGLMSRIAGELIRRDPRRRARIENLVAPTLARIIARSRDDGVLSPSERFSAEREMLSLLARTRPLIVLYDDLQWSDDRLAFADWLLAHPPKAPIVLVATVRAERAELDVDQAAILDRVLERAERIALTPLEPSDHAVVVEELLGLAPALSHDLRQRARGCPLFTVQTATEWVESGALTATAAGYAAGSGQILPMPRDLDELAQRRLERLVNTLPDPVAARRALQVAATLGDAVDGHEWPVACAGLDVPIPAGLVGALCDAGLATAGPDGWMFAHGFVRRALVAGLAEPARRRIHRACADAIEAGRSPAERRARHLIAAGADLRAVDALADAARGRMDRADYGRTLAVCAQRDALIERLGLPDDDVHRARTLPLEIAALRFSGRMEDAKVRADRFEGFPLAPEHGDLLAERARIRGARAVLMGDNRGHLDGYLEAVELYRRVGDTRGQARALHGIGWSHIIHGRFAEAIEAMQQSRRIAVEGGWRVDEGWSWHGVTAAHFYCERPGVEAAIAEGQRVFRAVRLPSGIALMRTERADAALLAGRDAEARGHAEAAREIFAAAGSHLVFRAEMTLSVLALRAGDPAEAQRRMGEAVNSGSLRGVAIQHRRGGHLMGAWVGLLMGDEQAFAHGLGVAEDDHARTFLHPAVRRILLEMGQRLEQLGRWPEARRVWSLAADHWRGIDPARSARCRARARATTGKL